MVGGDANHGQKALIVGLLVRNTNNGGNGPVSTFNGMPFTKGPSISGAYKGVNIGMCLAKKTRISPNKKLSSKGAY